MTISAPSRKWTNPGPVTRYCPACGFPKPCAHVRPVYTPPVTLSSDCAYTCHCPTCGTELEAITPEDDGMRKNGFV